MHWQRIWVVLYNIILLNIVRCKRLPIFIFLLIGDSDDVQTKNSGNPN